MSENTSIEVNAADPSIEVEGFVVVGPSPFGDHNHDHGELTGLADPDHPIAAVQGLQTALDGKETAGTAASSMSAHTAAADPHTGYQRETEKAAANGYASLDATTKVPFAQLPTGTSSSQVAIGNHSHTGTGHTIEDEGVALTQRTALNFTGAGVTATDTGGKTVVTIPGGGGGSQQWTQGTAAPTGGVDGDLYQRTAAPAVLYRNATGTWAPTGFKSAVFETNPFLKSAPWIAFTSSVRLDLNSASLSQLWNMGSTGVTGSPSGILTATDALAYGSIVSGSGLFMAATVHSLPSSGQLLKIGAGRNVLPSSNGYLYPSVVVNPAGQATLVEGANTIYTFPTSVSAGANNVFFWRVMTGAVLVLHRASATSAILSYVLYVSSTMSGGTLEAGIDWAVQGHGQFSIQRLEATV